MAGNMAAGGVDGKRGDFGGSTPCPAVTAAGRRLTPRAVAPSRARCRRLGLDGRTPCPAVAGVGKEDFTTEGTEGTEGTEEEGLLRAARAELDTESL